MERRVIMLEKNFPHSALWVLFPQYWQQWLQTIFHVESSIDGLLLLSLDKFRFAYHTDMIKENDEDLLFYGTRTTNLLRALLVETHPLHALHSRERIVIVAPSLISCHDSFEVLIAAFGVLVEQHFAKFPTRLHLLRTETTGHPSQTQIPQSQPIFSKWYLLLLLQSPIRAESVQTLHEDFLQPLAKWRWCQWTSRRSVVFHLPACVARNDLY